MVQRVEVNGVINEFPDEATPQMIAQALGVQPPDDDLSQSLYTKPQRFAKALGITNRTPVDNLRDLAAGVVSGLGKGGQFVASSLTGGNAPTGDVDKLATMIASNKPSTAGNILKGVGEYAPYGVLGGESLLGQTAAGALSGAATTNPNESNFFGILPSGKTGGSIESALLNLLTGGAAKGLEAARPSNVLRGTLSHEQLQKNVDVTAGTQTPLGDVISSPSLKRTFENILPYLPFSGASDAAQGVASDIKSQGKEIFSQLGVDKLGPNSGSELQDALKKAAADAREQKNKNYEIVNKMADDAGLNVGRDNFSNKANDILNEINLSPELKREMPSDVLSDLQSYADNKEGNTLKLSNIFKGKLGDKASDFYTNGRMYEYGFMKQLQDALGNDIDSSIEKSGTKALKDEYAQAQKDYQDKFAPFEDPDIVKYTRQGGDPDLILSHFIKTGQNDRATLLQKLVSKMSPTSKTLPLQMYLAKSLDNGEVNPLTFKTLYDKLGDNQKKVLINDDKTRDMLENYSDLVKKNTSPLTIMANPKTGQQNLDTQNTALLALLGHMASGNIGALGLAGGAVAGSRLATKALTSEAVRNALVKKMINNKSMFTGGAKIPSYQTAQQALMKALSGDNNQ